MLRRPHLREGEPKHPSRPRSTPDSTSVLQRFNWDPRESYDLLARSKPARNINRRPSTRDVICACATISAQGLKKGGGLQKWGRAAKSKRRHRNTPFTVD